MLKQETAARIRSVDGEESGYGLDFIEKKKIRLNEQKKFDEFFKDLKVSVGKGSEKVSITKYDEKKEKKWVRLFS